PAPDHVEDFLRQADTRARQLHRRLLVSQTLYELGPVGLQQRGHWSLTRLLQHLLDEQGLELLRDFTFGVRHAVLQIGGIGLFAVRHRGHGALETLQRVKVEDVDAFRRTGARGVLSERHALPLDDLEVGTQCAGALEVLQDGQQILRGGTQGVERPYYIRQVGTRRNALEAALVG